MTLILMIPPIQASAHLRASLLLRLTGEVLECITGYMASGSDLMELMDMLEELDNGWMAVLCSETWDSKSRVGVRLPPNAEFLSPPISQTDRTRLRSLLISGTDKLELWLDELPIEQWDKRIEEFSPGETVMEEQVLEITEVKERLDGVFRTALFHLTISDME